MSFLDNSDYANKWYSTEDLDAYDRLTRHKWTDEKFQQFVVEIYMPWWGASDEKKYKVAKMLLEEYRENKWPIPMQSGISFGFRVFNGYFMGDGTKIKQETGKKPYIGPVTVEIMNANIFRTGFRLQPIPWKTIREINPERMAVILVENIDLRGLADLPRLYSLSFDHFEKELSIVPDLSNMKEPKHINGSPIINNQLKKIYPDFNYDSLRYVDFYKEYKEELEKYIIENRNYKPRIRNREL